MAKRFVTALLVLSMLLTVGCLAGDGDGAGGPTATDTGETPTPTEVETGTPRPTETPEPTAEKVPLELSPGTNSTLRFVFTDVGEIRLIYPTDPGTPSMNYEGASVEPKYDLVAETLPPYLIWEDRVDRVVLEVPVEVPGKGRPGTYTFGMEKWNRSGIHEGGETVTREVTVVERK